MLSPSFLIASRMLLPVSINPGPAYHSPGDLWEIFDSGLSLPCRLKSPILVFLSSQLLLPSLKVSLPGILALIHPCMPSPLCILSLSELILSNIYHFEMFNISLSSEVQICISKLPGHTFSLTNYFFSPASLFFLQFSLFNSLSLTLALTVSLSIFRIAQGRSPDQEIPKLS